MLYLTQITFHSTHVLPKLHLPKSFSMSNKSFKYTPYYKAWLAVSNPVKKILILLIASGSGSMSKHQGSFSTVRFLYNTLKFLEAEQKMSSHTTWKKRK